MKKTLFIGLLLPLLSACATPRAARSPLIYEDANVAIYEICNGHWAPFNPPPICHQQVIQKNQTNNVNANVNLKTSSEAKAK